ncbi:hypothetical protein SEA_BRUHMOMENT_6 [Arthrobacter phage BruhMoment]|nr:hypothetical protein SEA_BRUHMOMENT_6 [Arthrobacter phage BruhMoment]
MATTHRPGCGHARTGRCICPYLTQWDAEASEPPVKEGYTRFYRCCGGYLDMPTDLMEGR